MKNKFKWFLLIFCVIGSFNVMNVKAESLTPQPMPSALATVFNTLKSSVGLPYYVIYHYQSTTTETNFYNVYFFSKPVHLRQEFWPNDKLLNTYFNLSDTTIVKKCYQSNNEKTGFSEITSGFGSEILKSSSLKEGGTSYNLILTSNYTFKTVEAETNGTFSSNVPSLEGLRIEFDATDEHADYSIKWNSKKSDYHVDMMLQYQYRKSIFGKSTTKTFLMNTYDSNIFDTGSYVLTYSSMLYATKNDNSEDNLVYGSEFEGYYFPKIYLRYSEKTSDGYRYGNWKYMTVWRNSQGDGTVDVGDATLDDKGNLVESPSESTFGSTGTPVSDSDAFGTMINGLADAPSLISSIGNGMTTIVNGVGQIPEVLASLLIGFPIEIWSLISVGISCMITIGIFKLIK